MPMPRQVGKGVFELTNIQKLGKSSPWIKDVFFDDKLLFGHIRDAVNDVKAKVPPYNPYLYESLMTDVSSALDRCLAYRRECAGLESQAVNRALEYDLFLKTSVNDETLNGLLTDTASLVKTQKGQADTAQALTKVGDPLKSLAPAYTGGALAATGAIANQTKKSTALADRLKLLRDYQDNLQMRHTTPGHALNHAERRGRVIVLIKQDVAEAYQKAVAARAGMIKQLGLAESPTYAFPVIAGDDTDVDFLDRFVLWTRDMIRAFEVYSEDEITFELVLPLANPYYSDFGSPPKAPSFYTGQTFANALTDIGPSGGLLTIDIKAALPAALRASAGDHYEPNVRLRAIGLSAGVAHDIDVASSWSAVIILPDQANPYDSVALDGQGTGRGREKIKRTPVVLGRIFPYRFDATPSIASGNEVWNADPTADLTSIFIQPMTVSGIDFINSMRGNTVLKDLKLHLKLAAKPTQALRDWMKGPLLASIQATGGGAKIR
jgi:hypothetical protein